MPLMTTADVMTQVRELLKQTPFRDSVKDISVEVSPYDADILQVTVHLADIAEADVDDSLEVVRRIQNGLEELDDRFPSVSFAEAA